MNLNTTLLTFIAGFVLAALIFVPLLLLAGRPSRAKPAPTGKHALRTGDPEPQESRDTRESRDNRATPKKQWKTKKTIVTPLRPVTTSAAATEPQREPVDQDSTPTEPRLPIEIITLPQLPSNLFERHFASKFARLRRRLDRLRSQPDVNQRLPSGSAINGEQVDANKPPHQARRCSERTDTPSR